jgi:hypothetical protein
MSGSDPDETRAIGRLPGLDIEIVHTPARPGEGERVTVTLQASGLPTLGYDPVLQWVRLAQLAWTPWLALTGALWALPRILDRR